MKPKHTEDFVGPCGSCGAEDLTVALHSRGGCGCDRDVRGRSGGGGVVALSSPRLTCRPLSFLFLYWLL